MTSPSGETAAGVQHEVLLLVSHDGHEQGPHLPGVCLLCLSVYDTTQTSVTLGLFMGEALTRIREEQPLSG